MVEQANNQVKRARLASLSIYIPPQVKPVTDTHDSKPLMSYNHRPLSPGGRRIQNQGRASENTLTDPYYQSRHGSYASPRSSGVIPISTQTFVTTQPPSGSRPGERYDSYTGRPRRSSLVDTQRSTIGSSSQLPSRARPIIQQDFARPSSPVKTSRDKDYYITPASSSQEPRVTTSTHKKLYAVDGEGAKLVADVNIPAGEGRNHKRRDSVDRGSSYNRSSGTERDRNRRSYHANGTVGRPKDKSIDDDDAYSYTDAAGMYRETEPRWREVRPRRGSLDRGAAQSRERPVSVIDPTFGIRPPNAKEIGPPPSTRGWDKINDLGRTRSHRDGPREVAQSPTRGRAYYQEPTAYGDSRDQQYHVPPRPNSTDRRATGNNYDGYDYEDRMPRRPERRNSATRDARPDASIERRGFGIRTDLRPESQSRFGGRDARGSDESFEQSRAYRDSGYAEPHRRETAPEFYPHDIARMEQEKRDRELAQRLQSEEQGRPRERGYSDLRDYSRRREDSYVSEYDRARDRDSEYDSRDRARHLEPSMDRGERHHRRRETDRDGDYPPRKENSPRQTGDSKPGFAQTAAAGLAGAIGLSSIFKRDKDKDKDKDDYQERDRVERDDRNDRGERRNGEERDYPRERRPGQAASDEPPYERNQERERSNKDGDRGLGLAFEAPPEPPRSAPPMNPEWNQPPERKPEERRPEWNQPQDRKPEERRPEWNPPQERKPEERRPEWTSQPSNVERSSEQQRDERNQERTGARDSDRERDYNNKPAEQPSVALDDADEDYRRRMEQVQRELGRVSLEDQRNADSDPDRERRRREREQRQRERESRGGPTSAPVAANIDSGFNEMPPHPALRRSFDDQSALGTASTTSTMPSTELKRKPSILDRPMTTEPAQIIDNSLSEKRENRVRIVDPPTEEEERKPRGILKKPTEKFPEDPNAVREGVAPLKDATKKGIPPGARWTKIDRRLVNPEALEAAHERFEERLDCVIVLRVLTKEEIQTLADRTREIRDRRYEEEREERRPTRRTDRNRDRRDQDEYEYSDSEDEFKSKPPKMLEAPTSAGASNNADFVNDSRNRRHEREREADPVYNMSGGLGRRDDSSQGRY